MRLGFCIRSNTPDNLTAIAKKEGVTAGCVGLSLRGDGNFDCDAWVKIISHLQKKQRKRVYFVFNCKAHDHHIYRKLSQKIEVLTFSQYYDFPVVLNLMKAFDMIISDRYHALIFAILANTPIIPINPTYKTVKTEGLMALFDYPVEVAPRVNIKNCDKLISSIDYIEHHAGQLRELLAKASRELIAKGRADIKKISRIDATLRSANRRTRQMACDRQMPYAHNL